MHPLLLLLSISSLSFAQESPETEEQPQDSPPAEDPSPETDIQADVDAFLGSTSSDPASEAPAPSAPNVFNPRITAFGDLLLSTSLHDREVNPASTAWLRSLEIDLRSDVDPYAKAVAVIAIEQESPLENHPEEGDGTEAHSGFTTVAEEVYLDLVALPAHLSARIGQQLLPFGVTNRMHPHDWPWPDMPLPFARLMGDHGVSDLGAVMSYRVHNPWNKALTLEGGVTTGAFFDEEASNPAPGWVGRVEYFDDFGSLELGLGASAMGLGQRRLEGADVMLRWRGEAWRSVVLIGELVRQGAYGSEGVGDLGWVGTLQVQPSRPLYLGFRIDGLADEQRYGGTVSFYTSEFLRLRVGSYTDGDEIQVDGQLTFVWGSHPVEPYWVNR